MKDTKGEKRTIVFLYMIAVTVGEGIVVVGGASPVMHVPHALMITILAHVTGWLRVRV
jgi:hypothetical protein